MTQQNNNSNRNSLKIDQEEFNRKAQHILDTVVKPQVEKYEQSKIEDKNAFLFEKSLNVDDETFELILKETMIPAKHLGKK